MGPIVCAETSVINYHYSLRNSPEERSYHLQRGGSLKSRMITSFFKTRAKCFLLERKRSWTKLAGEYCWAITQVAGRSCRGRSGYRVSEFGFNLTTTVWIFKTDLRKIWLAPEIPKRRYYCVNREVLVKLLNTLEI
jgi:hypothetical protein